MHVIDHETRRFGRVLNYAGLVVTALCATAAYSLVHAPMMAKIADKRVQIDELILSVRNASVARAQHAKLSSQLEEVKQRIVQVQQRLPRDADAGEFLKQLTQIASEEQLAITDFEPEKPADREGYAEMYITLKGAGSFASICAFLDGLSKLQRLSKVKNLKLTAGDHSNIHPMTATLVIYFGLAADEALGAAVVRGSAERAQRGSTGGPATTPPSREARRG